MEAGGQCHTLAALRQKKRPSTHCTGVWVGPRASLEGCGKSHPQWNMIHRTIQPIVSRYTNYMILAHTHYIHEE